MKFLDFRKRQGKFMKIKNGKVIAVFGMVSCLLAGCGSVIPELTEEEAALIATYAADVILENSEEKFSRLIDTQAETTRLNELAEKVQQLKKTQALEGKGEKADAAGNETANAGTGNNTAGEIAAQVFLPGDMAEIIGLDGFQISYEGYEIAKSYAAEGGTEWEPTIDASRGKNLLIAKFQVTNTGAEAAVADMLSKNMLFSFNGDNGINGMALMTMLLNDFAYAKDKIAAGAGKQYVLITQIDENITEVGTLSLRMKAKNGGKSMTVALQ